MNPFFLSGAPRAATKAVSFLRTLWSLIAFVVCSLGVVGIWNRFRALLEISAWQPSLPLRAADLTRSSVLRLLSGFSAQFFTHVWNAESGIAFSILLNVFLSILLIYFVWKKSSPKAENAERQQEWGGLGQDLGASGPPVSSHVEQRGGEEVEEAEEDAEEGPSPTAPPSRAAAERAESRGEESEEEEFAVSAARPAREVTEFHGSREQFVRHPNEAVVTWLLRCWDSGASSVLLDGNGARQLGSIAGDSAMDRGISRCLRGVTTLWERMLLAVKERHPFKGDLEPEVKRWKTLKEGIQYLRETAVVEMLYDPMFVPNDPRPNRRDPENVWITSDVVWNLTRTAPERYLGVLASMSHRYEKQQRRPPVIELIIRLQIFEQQLLLFHSYVSATSEITERMDKADKRMDKAVGKKERKQGGVPEEASLSMNRGEPVAASETANEDQDLTSLLKELIALIKGDEPSSSPAPPEISAIHGKRSPPQANDSSRCMARAALWSYLREHGEDMKEWRKKPTAALRARVRELQQRSTSVRLLHLLQSLIPHFKGAFQGSQGVLMGLRRSCCRRRQGEAAACSAWPVRRSLCCGVASAPYGRCVKPAENGG
ncbi:uncharacterized protein LOC128091953 isoform X3 [Tympanuchus pallidicinctus]|uniref:uncharacterized protein LOC128091953 isoform X3 n=1 Tax=Tympanuchus pallidicinctus TaxID=109042 RepID=UPI0022871D5B|nr:uncharacterized protein LOC128091953 isoform X3 [Tympanuchus pallidicinctus]